MKELENERTEKPEDCDSCHYETPRLTRYADRVAAISMGGRVLWLCPLCAETLAGNAARWPEQYRDRGDVLRTICYVGNVILDTLKSKK